MKKLLAIMFLLLSVLQLGAQTDSLRLRYVAEGKVLDAKRGKPMAAVHVSVPGRNHATVTNADGRFVLRSDEPINLLDFSFVGYRIQREKNEGKFLTVKMVKEDAVLQEASIVYAEPWNIIESALDKIWDSYCTEPELLECFYRETVQKRSRYIYVSEAVAHLYKYKYNKAINRDAATIEKGRIIVSQNRKDTLSVKMQGGPNLAIWMDVVKNPDVLLDKKELKLYNFSMGRPEYINDRLQFVIKISPAYEDNEYPLYYGTLYIDRELLTFTRAELNLDMKNKARVTKALLVSKPSSLRFTPKSVSFVLNYSLDNEKSRLSYFKSEIKFSCDWRKRLFKTNYTVTNEMVITDVLTPAEPIQKVDQFRNKDILSDKVSEFFDPDFWKDYNIIAPSESLENAIKKLKK